MRWHHVSVLREYRHAGADLEAEQRISLQKAALVAEEIDILAPLVDQRPRGETGAAELAGLAVAARRADVIGKSAGHEQRLPRRWSRNRPRPHSSGVRTVRGKVRHAEVRAPLSGAVSAVHVKTVGAVVQAGTMLAEIVPSEAEYLVRAQINPQDIADVQPGQVARISLAAYDPSRYGVVMGVVRRVASNTTQPENAMPFYETIIAIPEVAFTKSPDEPVISSGMPLQVDILGGKRTVMEYIMTPIQKSLATAFREK